MTRSDEEHEPYSLPKSESESAKIIEVSQAASVTGSNAEASVTGSNAEASVTGSNAEASANGSNAHSDVFAQGHIAVENNVFFCAHCRNKNKKQTWLNRSTSNFRRHLQNKHPDIYVQGSKVQSKLTHHGFTRPGAGAKRKDFCATTFDSNDKNFADKKLTDWIVNDSQSFSVVEQPDFIEFCESLRSEYPLRI